MYRLIAKNTVEEAMLKCAQDKLKLEKDVTGIGASGEYSILVILWLFLVLSLRKDQELLKLLLHLASLFKKKKNPAFLSLQIPAKQVPTTWRPCCMKLSLLRTPTDPCSV